MHNEPFHKEVSRSLVLLSLAYFIQGTTALSIVGGLESITQQLHLSRVAVALLVTAFGITFAVFAPILQMLVGHWPHRTQILSGLSIMGLGAIGFAIAPNYPILIATRVVMGFGAAMISPVLSALGASIVKAEHQGRALAVVLMGLTISTVIGVPISSWIVQRWGVRILFVVLAAVIFAVAALIRAFIRDVSSGGRVSARDAAALVKRPATLGGFVTVFFLTAGVFSTYSMITPVLHDRYGASPHAISIALLTFGVAGVVGNAFLRRTAGIRSAETLLIGATSSLIAVFALLISTPAWLPILFVGLIVWAFVADVIWPTQQRRIVELESKFKGVALALNASFMFTGISVGSWLGGMAYTARGFAAVGATSIALLGLALLALVLSMQAKRREVLRELRLQAIPA